MTTPGTGKRTRQPVYRCRVLDRSDLLQDLALRHHFSLRPSLACHMLACNAQCFRLLRSEKCGFTQTLSERRISFRGYDIGRRIDIMNLLANLGHILDAIRQYQDRACVRLSEQFAVIFIELSRVICI
jgi:hypothetical protein